MIARQRIADLTGISLRGRLAPLVLRFRDRSRMRLFAIPVPRRQALRDALLALVPDANRVRIRTQWLIARTRRPNMRLKLSARWRRF